MAIYGELKRYPLFINRYIRIIKYWLKVINSENIIVHQLYNSLFDDFVEGKRNWIYHVKNVLDIQGFSDIWLYPEYVHVNNYILLFIRRFMDNVLQSWYVYL